MNIQDAPNDKENYKGKSEIRKKLYVTNDDGSYTSVTSDGWEVENFATTQAWHAVEDDIEAIKQRVLKGELSPIAYHMHKCLMELPVLARHVGKWQWQVKKHMRPDVYKKLDTSILEKYAHAFNIEVDQLNNLS